MSLLAVGLAAVDPLPSESSLMRLKLVLRGPDDLPWGTWEEVAGLVRSTYSCPSRTADIRTESAEVFELANDPLRGEPWIGELTTGGDVAVTERPCEADLESIT